MISRTDVGGTAEEANKITVQLPCN